MSPAGIALMGGLALAGCGGPGSAPSSASTQAATGHAAGTSAKVAAGEGAAGSTSTAASAGTTPPALATGSFRGAVPILMYHVIATAPAGATYPALFVSPLLFLNQMRALKAAGYKAVTQLQMWRAWHGGPGLPSKPVVISFDDGYQGQATHAAVSLRSLGWPGVLNLELHNLHVDGGLNASEVKTMIADGWEIDAHTLTHPDLPTVDPARLTTEVTGSRRAIQKQFGVSVPFFCYPAGKYDASVEAAVQAAGYRGATTENPGAASKADDPDALPRIRVNGGDSPATVLAAVRAAGA